MPRDEIMAPYADGMKEDLGENVYNAGIVDGVQYGIGRLLDQASFAVFTIRADVAEHVGYTNGDPIASLDDMTHSFSHVLCTSPYLPPYGPDHRTAHRD